MVNLSHLNIVRDTGFWNKDRTSDKLDMNLDILTSFPAFLLYLAIFIAIKNIIDTIRFKKLERQIKARQDQMWQQVDNMIAKEKKEYFENNPNKTYADFKEYSSAVFQEKLKKYNENSSDVNEGNNHNELQQINGIIKKKHPSLISKEEWREASLIHKIWIMLVLFVLITLILIYLKEIVLIIALVVITIVVIITIIIISSFMH